LSSSACTKIGGKSKRLGNGQMALDVGEGSTVSLDFLDDLSSSLVHDGIDSSDDSLGALNLDKEDRLHKAGLSSELSGIEDTSSGGDNLTSSSMDGISVKSDVQKVESNSSHVLLGKDSLSGNPLKGSNHRILDFSKIRNSLGAVNKNVGSIGVGAKRPNLTSFGDIPSVILGKLSSTELRLVLGVNIAVVDGLGKSVFKRSGGTEESIVFVGGLRKADLA